jgi:Transposase DDE domain
MNALDEDWKILLGLFPPDWLTEAHRSGAVARLRGFESVNEVLRTLLMHVGCGYSLRETAVRAKAAGVADVSDVTLLNRLRQAEGWLQHLCQKLVKESGVEWRGPEPRRRVRAVDATIIKEPGKTGSQWRLHFSLELPELRCDFFQITAAEGQETGEHLRRFPVKKGDLILADRGYSNPPGVAAVYGQEADLIVRVNTAALPLFGATGRPLALLPMLRNIRTAGAVREWPAWVQEKDKRIAGRVCVLRKSEQAIALAQRRITLHDQKRQRQSRPETREYARYVIVFTTVLESEMSAVEVLEYYRFRWQIELLFKQLKSILAMGHLPKYDDQSSRAWLYGKLLVALLTQKLVRLGSAISPWGYDIWPTASTQPLA